MTKELEEKLIQECHEWKGTKWAHCVALKGYKADCIQFIIVVFQNIGLIDKNFKTQKYQQDWALHNSHSVLMDEMTKHCLRVKLTDIRIGDVITFDYGKCTSHAALYIGAGKIVHSKIRQGVVESYLVDYDSIINSVWRLKNG